jgi:hypothetical protein
MNRWKPAGRGDRWQLLPGVFMLSCPSRGSPITNHYVNYYFNYYFNYYANYYANNYVIHEAVYDYIL